ncbi:MAG: sigma-54-dependent Fis family transcriptional regulator [Deltaproteobacteria bacterium]|nr:sigma-54-dependent Fis family transcriptional regulator [Deltaproteobacteria bacterium]
MLIRLVIAVEEKSLGTDLRRALAHTGTIVEVLNGEDSTWERITRRTCDVLVVSRGRLPSPPEEIVTNYLERPDAATLVVLGPSFDEEERAALLAAGCQTVLESSIGSAALADVLQTTIAKQAEYIEQKALNRRLVDRPGLADFSSSSPAMSHFLDTVHRIVNAGISLLILGETGVGKERLAQAIHYDSARSKSPFVAINCGALPETLLESELFGHEKGAFTGAATSRRGCFELAHGGTIFLDEIGELAPHLQVKLLRVLQEREIRRLGAERATPVDVRVMAATNRDLDAEIEHGRFRQDLYFRLSVMTLTIPPLRERTEDIPELAQNYIDYTRPRLGTEIYGMSPEVRDALMRYPWPGNVRELVNVVERAMLLCPGEEITLDQLPDGIIRAARSVPSSEIPTHNIAHSPAAEWLKRPWRDVRREVLERAEKAYLEALLKETRGHIGQTAHRAGMQPRSLFDKLKYYGLSKEDFRG